MAALLSGSTPAVLGRFLGLRDVAANDVAPSCARMASCGAFAVKTPTPSCLVEHADDRGRVSAVTGDECDGGGGGGD